MTTTATRPADRVTNRVADAAARLFDWSELKPAQLEAIESLLSGRDTFGIMPTGFGKSAIYQVAGALLDGPTVVVSPLISSGTPTPRPPSTSTRATRMPRTTRAGGASMLARSPTCSWRPSSWPATRPSSGWHGPASRW
jgi:hypothetical protein